MGKYMRSRCLIAISVLFLVAIFTRISSAQYLRRSVDEEERVYVQQTYSADWFLRHESLNYKTYAFNPFENYDNSVFPYVTARRNFYSPLGDLLIKGYDVAWWRESRSSASRGESLLFKNQNRYQMVFNNVVLSSDHTDRWSASAMFGNEILTIFTPLTFYWSGLNGFRGDFTTGKTRISLIGSRINEPIYPRDWGVGFDVNNVFAHGDPVILFGGHAERRIGILNVGATYVNLHTSNVDRGGESFKGVFPSSRVAPIWLAIKVADDSPEDESGGPRVFDVAMWINGEKRDDVPINVVLYGSDETLVGKTSSITGKFTKSAYASFDGGINWCDLFSVMSLPRRIPLFVDYLYLLDYLNGQDVSSNVNMSRLESEMGLLPGVAQGVDGDNYLIYYFDLSSIEDISSVELGFLVGNDYSISISEVQKKGNIGKYENRYRAEIFRVVARASGNVQDLSNVRWVRFKYGGATGLSLYSVNMHADFSGFRLEGEYAVSVEHNQYPNGSFEGDRFNRRGKAWYLLASKDWERWGIGSELFSMHPDYLTYMMSSVPYDYARYFTKMGFVNDTGLWILVQDNDDHDRWPDTWMGDVSEGVQIDQDVDGVFPGKDEDQDGLPDTNKNYNGVPDYAEPFLMYDAESDDYVYGIDLNNNDVVDEREDDMDPEYPYDLDLGGYHLIGWIEPLDDLRFTLGRLDSRQMAGGRENRVLYGRVSYVMEGVGWGKLGLEHEIKRVHDSIPDQIVRVSESTSRYYYAGEYGVQFPYQKVSDELNYRNSLVNRSYLSSSLKLFRNLAIVNNLKLEINERHETLFGDGTFQSWDRIRVLAGVHRVGYTFDLDKWNLIPQLKIIYLKKDRRSVGIPLIHERQVIPILKAEYKLTDKTAFKLGFQGFPFGGLEYRLKDFTDSSGSFRRQTRVFFVSNQSEYFGYQIVMNAGLMYDKIHYLDVRQRRRNSSMTSMFLRIFLGYE